MENERLAYLLARKMAQEADAEEEKELEQLLQQYPYASYTAEVLMQPWKDAARSHGNKDVDTLLENHMVRLEQTTMAAETTHIRSGRNPWLYTAIAASVVILLGLWMLLKPAASPVTRQLAVRADQALKAPKKKILLPDGSTVWLNAGSKLEYPEQFDKKDRIVTLEGEAFFDIVKDAHRPFLVKTAEFSIRVLGTSFDVRAYPHEDSAVAALIQGAIEVVLKGSEDQAIQLRPNEKLTIPVFHTPATDDKIKSEQLSAPLIKAPLTTLRDSLVAETAWVQNKLAFKHMPLEQVARLMGEWYNADIRFRNDSRKSLYFSGVFEKEDLKEALNVLSLTTQSFRYTEDANGVIWIE